MRNREQTELFLWEKYSMLFSLWNFSELGYPTQAWQDPTSQVGFRQNNLMADLVIGLSDASRVRTEKFDPIPPLIGIVSNSTTAHSSQWKPFEAGSSSLTDEQISMKTTAQISLAFFVFSIGHQLMFSVIIYKFTHVPTFHNAEELLHVVVRLAVVNHCSNRENQFGLYLGESVKDTLQYGKRDRWG